jgi:hypothetical protein
VAVFAAQMAAAAEPLFVSRLADAWANAPPSEVRCVSTFVNRLKANQCEKEARRLIPALLDACRPTKDGWLAVASLLYLGELAPENIVDVIRVADFGQAPNRALKFGTRLDFVPEAQRAFRETLRDRLADGSLNRYLLTWLLQTAPVEIRGARWDELVAWLAKEEHKSVTDVRVKVMDLLQRQNAELDAKRLAVARDIRDWLSGESPVQKRATDVRGKYLDFLCWPRGKPDKKADRIGPYDLLDDCDLEIKNEFAGARAQAADATLVWLNEPEGRDDTLVRTKFLEFLLAMPAREEPFHYLRSEVATQTWHWLNREGVDSTDVRTKYLQFLWAMQSDEEPFASLRPEVASETVGWLQHRTDAADTQEVLGALLDVACGYGEVSFVHSVINLALEAMRDHAPGTKPTRHQNIVQRLIKLLRRRPDAFAAALGREKQRAVSHAVNVFKERNPGALSGTVGQAPRRRTHGSPSSRWR